MERRTALAIALAAAGTISAASAAFAVNVGLLQHDTNKPGGVLDASLLDASFPTDTSDPTVVTVYVDDLPVPVTAASGSGQSELGTTTTPSASLTEDDDADIEHDDSGHDETEHDDDDD